MALNIIIIFKQKEEEFGKHFITAIIETSEILTLIEL